MKESDALALCSVLGLNIIMNIRFKVQLGALRTPQCSTPATSPPTLGPITCLDDFLPSGPNTAASAKTTRAQQKRPPLRFSTARLLHPHVFGKRDWWANMFLITVPGGQACFSKACLVNIRVFENCNWWTSVTYEQACFPKRHLMNKRVFEKHDWWTSMLPGVGFWLCAKSRRKYIDFAF